MFRRGYILYILTTELQTADVAYFQRKIQLSGFFAYPDGSPSQLILSGVLLLFTDETVWNSVLKFVSSSSSSSSSSGSSTSGGGSRSK